MYFKVSLFCGIRELSSNSTYTFFFNHCIYKKKNTHTYILTKAQKPKRKKKSNIILYDYHLVPPKWSIYIFLIGKWSIFLKDKLQGWNSHINTISI